MHFCLVVVFSTLGYAQNQPKENDSLQMIYLIEGDTIPRSAIELNEVIVLPRLSFKDSKARRDYLILRRRTLKVYPYAKLAAERLVTRITP